MKTRLPFIDFAKAFAILGIALYHYLLPLGGNRFFDLAISFGGTGIHLFFFLSGYGLGMSKYSSAIDFYRRRFSKVLIPYFVFVTLIFLVNIFLPLYAENGWKDYLAHIFLYKMFSNQSIGSFGFHLWFMSTLVQLYLFFPILINLMKRLKPIFVVITTLLVSISYILWVVNSGHAYERPWNSFFLTYLWEFALGVALGLKNDTRLFTLSIPKYIFLWIAGLGGMAIFTLKLGQTGRLLNDLPAFVAITSFTLMFYYSLGKLKFLTPIQEFFIRSGGLSYEFYLVHYVGFSLFQLFQNQHGLTYDFWVVPLLVIFSWLLAFVLQGINKRIPVR